MVDFRTKRDLKNIPVAGKSQYYIYIMETDEYKMKIGITSNIYQRYKSLCGSNSQGHPPIRVYCSPETYLYSLEKNMQNRFIKYRLPNSEWFYDNGISLFFQAVEEFEKILNSSSYERCNENRKNFVQSKKN